MQTDGTMNIPGQTTSPCHPSTAAYDIEDALALLVLDPWVPGGNAFNQQPIPAPAELEATQQACLAIIHDAERLDARVHTLNFHRVVMNIRRLGEMCANRQASGATGIASISGGDHLPFDAVTLLRFLESATSLRSFNTGKPAPFQHYIPRNACLQPPPLLRMSDLPELLARLPVIAPRLRSLTLSVLIDASMVNDFFTSATAAMRRSATGRLQSLAITLILQPDLQTQDAKVTVKLLSMGFGLAGVLARFMTPRSTIELH